MPMFNAQLLNNNHAQNPVNTAFSRLLSKILHILICTSFKDLSKDILVQQSTECNCEPILHVVTYHQHPTARPFNVQPVHLLLIKSPTLSIIDPGSQE